MFIKRVHKRFTQFWPSHLHPEKQKPKPNRDRGESYSNQLQQRGQETVGQQRLSQTAVYRITVAEKNPVAWVAGGCYRPLDWKTGCDMLQWFVSYCVDLRFEKSGGEGSETVKREGWRRKGDTLRVECHHAGMHKKRCSTGLELGEHHQTHSLDRKNGFIDTLDHDFLLLTAVLLVHNTGVWNYSYAGETLFSLS